MSLYVLKHIIAPKMYLKRKLVLTLQQGGRGEINDGRRKLSGGEPRQHRVPSAALLGPGGNEGLATLVHRDFLKREESERETCHFTLIFGAKNNQSRILLITA